MREVTLAVGSLAVVPSALARAGVEVGPGADVVAVMTATAFTGMADAAVALAEALAPLGASVEALMVADREAASELYFADRLARADLVVLVDGAALHARAVWRATPLGDAIAAARVVVAVGSVASVLGAVMVDPRGGAPTTGLAQVAGAVTCVPASAEQLARTRSLLGDDETLVVLGPRAAVIERAGSWRVVFDDDLVVTRGERVVTLGPL